MSLVCVGVCVLWAQGPDTYRMHDNGKPSGWQAEGASDWHLREMKESHVVCVKRDDVGRAELVRGGEIKNAN